MTQVLSSQDGPFKSWQLNKIETELAASHPEDSFPEDMLSFQSARRSWAVSVLQILCCGGGAEDGIQEIHSRAPGQRAAGAGSGGHQRGLSRRHPRLHGRCRSLSLHRATPIPLVIMSSFFTSPASQDACQPPHFCMIGARCHGFSHAGHACKEHEGQLEHSMAACMAKWRDTCKSFLSCAEQ